MFYSRVKPRYARYYDSHILVVEGNDVLVKPHDASIAIVPTERVVSFKEYLNSGCEPPRMTSAVAFPAVQGFLDAEACSSVVLDTLNDLRSRQSDSSDSSVSSATIADTSSSDTNS